MSDIFDQASLSISNDRTKKKDGILRDVLSGRIDQHPAINHRKIFLEELRKKIREGTLSEIRSLVKEALSSPDNLLSDLMEIAEEEGVTTKISKIVQEEKKHDTGKPPVRPRKRSRFR